MAATTDLRRVLADHELRGLVVLFVIVMLLGQLYTQAVPLVFDAAGLSAAVLGAAWSVTKAVDVAVSPAVGFLSDVADRETAAAVGLAALAVPFAGFFLARGVAALVGLMVAVTAVRALVNTAGTAGMNEAVDADVAGTGWGVRDVALYLGSAAGLLGGAVVGAAAGIRLVFPLLALVAAGGSLVVVRQAGPGQIKSSLAAGLGWVRSVSLGDSGLEPVAVVRAAVATPFTSFRAVSDAGLLARLCVVKGLVAVGWGMCWFLLPVFALEVGLTEQEYFLLFAAANVLGVPLSLLGGLLADRYSRKALFVGNYWVEAVVLGIFAVTREPALFAVGMALYAAQTLFEPGVMAYFFAQFDDEEAGRIWGVSGAVVKAVGVVAPAAGGAVYAREPSAVFLVGAAFVAAGGLLALGLPGEAV